MGPQSPVFDFSNKTIFVAGGTSGINLGIALRFAEAGARVAVLSRNPDKVNASVDQLIAQGARACGYSADVRDPQAVQQALEAAAAELGPLDVVVSGAAGNFPAPAQTLSPNGFKSVMDIDVLGTFHVLKHSFDYLNKPGAALINISAPQAFVAMPLQTHVCAAKAGVDMLTRSLALEWGPLGVRINSIVPGPIADTEGMARLAPTPKLQAGIAQTVPLKRFGHAYEIGDAALFLASSAATYINGAVLPVDGGWSLAGAGTAASMMEQAFNAAQ